MINSINFKLKNKILCAISLVFLFAFTPSWSASEDTGFIMGNKSNLISNNWESWNLLIVTMDKSNKPVQQAAIDLSKPVKLSRKNGPEISIEQYTFQNNEGRLVKISCNGDILTQKFATTLQLPGWAFETTCKKQKYYFIIN